MWGGLLSFMKKQNLKYTEHFFYISDKSPLGWLKIALACILLRPIRLVNEIGKKLIFLEKDSLLYVLRVSIVLNVFLLLSNFLESIFLEQEQKTYIPFSVLCFCLLLLCLSYWKIYSLNDYSFSIAKDRETFSVKESESDDVIFDVSQEDIKGEEVFSDISADDILFNDPINLFIQDPDELEKLDIHPAAYLDAEESRLLNAIENNSSIFDNESIELPDLSDDEFTLGEDDQIADIMEELQKQLQ